MSSKSHPNHPKSLRCHLADTFKEKQNEAINKNTGEKYEYIYVMCCECYKVLEKNEYKVNP